MTTGAVRCATLPRSVGRRSSLKIATYNINNVNKRFDPLAAWLKDAKPDVVCLQELKCEDREFPVGELRRLGYRAVWRGQKSWNGVAILARGTDPVLTTDRLPGDESDTQSRYIEAAVRGVLIGCIYLPNGNPQPGPKFDYKLVWFERLIRHARSLKRAGVPAVLAGDLNVVPTEFDIYPKHSYGGDALLQPQPRAAFKRLLRQGWTDAMRYLHPHQPKFSYWSYMRNRWPRNKGLRLDFLLLSEQVAAGLVAADVDHWVRGEDEASDHAPVWALNSPVHGRRWRPSSGAWTGEFVRQQIFFCTRRMCSDAKCLQSANSQCFGAAHEFVSPRGCVDH
jgi:exodeoxyribonuclease III